MRIIALLKEVTINIIRQHFTFYLCIFSTIAHTRLSFIYFMVHFFITLLYIKLATSFVKPTSSDIPHPFNHVVVGVVEFGFKHLQISNL